MGRSFAESGMTDTCTIRRISDQYTDQETGRITPVYTTVYVGMCEVQQHEAQARAEDAGEDYVLMRMILLKVPVSAVGIESGDEATIDTSSHDADLPGRVFKIRDLHNKTHATARRLSGQERIS
jgi:hypothetical protein